MPSLLPIYRINFTEFSVFMSHLVLKKTYRLLYWILPLAILFFVYTKIDLSRLFAELKRVDIWLYLLALMFFPFMVLIGAMRWKVLASQYFGKSEKFSYLLRHYWIGMSIGFFMPASVGWDIYRVMLLGRRYGNYAANVAIILIEKFLALFVCMGMILFLYPFISPYGLSSDITTIIDIAFYLFMFCLFFLLFAVLVKKITLFQTAITCVESKLKQMFFAILNKIKINSQKSTKNISWEVLLKPITNPKFLISPILLSIANIFIAGVRIHFFFEALHYDIPFIVNVFVAPIFFFIFILPISFGSIGIREGAFIFIYGLFGVPAETALIVSFFSLTGILINNAVGGLLIYTTKKQDISLKAI